ncbi:DUF92 domain-containing protein [Porifericola rhodea]|uniref:DUF92 domain-containing protein n=1 Tax=Porifericola rhodea TaxID=930972 RepID=UPI002665D20A|nr:DUF92 domain-containing protein [Porifericola rhodea]WKN30693.1 DUF92 domain-containing protein [Porifericola rhodea]
MLLVFLGVSTNKITIRGAVAGGGITFLLLLAFQWLGLLMIASFFALGTLASVWKSSEKRRQGTEEKNRGKRDYVNVLANGGVASIASIFAILLPQNYNIWLLAMSASFAVALSDTFSSEFGNIYGNRCINVLSGKEGRRGEDGLISIEGSLFGILGSSLISLLFYAFYTEYVAIFIVFIAGIAGNLIDSILGASLQRKGVLNNHTVNFYSILIASSLASLTFYLLTN